MGQSLVNHYIHIIFSTKNREELIIPSIEYELFSYLGGICNRLKCQTVKVGGHLDHVHILCMLSKQITISQLLEDIKSNSSKWIKTKGEDFKNFYWQDGYASFSISRGHVDELIRYIDNLAQRSHSRRM